VTGRYPAGSPVLTRYPLTPEQQAGDRSAWPWVPGTIIGQVAADEWNVVIEIPELAPLEDGTPALPGTNWADLCFPAVFRDSSEIRGGAR
jgi:hypothetical protein